MAENSEAGAVERLVEETGSSSVDELRDMASVGLSLVEVIGIVTADGPYKDWAPADNPTEIVTDLINDLDEEQAKVERLTRDRDDWRKAFETMNEKAVSNARERNAQTHRAEAAEAALAETRAHLSCADAAVHAARVVIVTAFDTYKKRNGSTGTIEGDDGEKCWIVPFDPFEELRAALLRADNPWRAITKDDCEIATIQTFGDVVLRNSYPAWVRDADGRTYEAVWTVDDKGRGYWWDLEGESPVDPTEIYPHPLSVAQAVADEGDALSCFACGEPFKADDICATDITEGTAHAACLEGAAIVDMETGEPSEGPIETWRYGDRA